MLGKNEILEKNLLNNKVKTEKMHEECRRFLLCIGVVIFLLFGGFYGCPYAFGAGDPALEAGFLPHKALYDIRLSSKKSGSLISNLSGKMMYEWHSSCDGWVSTYQFDMLYEYVAMPATRITSDFSTYESFDGRSFNFTVQRKKDGAPYEHFRGATETVEEGRPEKIIYYTPEGLVQDLPEGTFFPVSHTLDVMEKIKQGEHYYSAKLFDGSDGEGPVEVNTFIGKEYTYQLPEQESGKDEEETKGNIDPALVNTKAWDIRLAFFPLDSSDTIADYEMSVVFHENGVISSMEIEYADFSVSQNLVAIELVESGCERDAPQEENKNGAKK